MFHLRCQLAVLEKLTIPVLQATHEDEEVMPPIPASCLRIGCPNACGLRGKASMGLQLGRGIWCFSETHLTAALQRTVAATLVGLGRQQHRNVRAHLGCPCEFLPQLPSSRDLEWRQVSLVTSLHGKSPFPGRMGSDLLGD